MPWYEIKLNGRLDPAAATIPGFQALEHPAVTVLCGHVGQPSELTALLARVSAQGLEVTEVHQVPRSRACRVKEDAR
jgi:hypothetical protein